MSRKWGRETPRKSFKLENSDDDVSRYEHAPGIVFHSTASHGGYHLSVDRWKDFTAIPHFAQWIAPWLEEDCDACLVYLRWPELATNEQIHGAVLMARTVASWGNGRWVTLVEGWLDKPEQSLLITRAQQHANDVAHLWERGSMSSTRQQGVWWVSFSRGTERREIHMEYPTKRYYTDAELDAASQAAPAKQSSPKHCVGSSSVPCRFIAAVAINLQIYYHAMNYIAANKKISLRSGKNEQNKTLCCDGRRRYEDFRELHRCGSSRQDEERNKSGD